MLEVEISANKLKGQTKHDYRVRVSGDAPAGPVSRKYIGEARRTPGGFNFVRATGAYPGSLPSMKHFSTMKALKQFVAHALDLRPDRKGLPDNGLPKPKVATRAHDDSDIAAELGLDIT